MNFCNYTTLGQGQVMTLTFNTHIHSYIPIESLMLHTKFRENRPAGSGVEDFLRFFTIYGGGGHPGHMTQMTRTKFRSFYQRRLHIKFSFDRPSGF